MQSRSRNPSIAWLYIQLPKKLKKMLSQSELANIFQMSTSSIVSHVIKYGIVNPGSHERDSELEPEVQITISWRRFRGGIVNLKTMQCWTLKFCNGKKDLDDELRPG
jgi:hypothetical protein